MLIKFEIRRSRVGDNGRPAQTSVKRKMILSPGADCDEEADAHTSQFNGSAQDHRNPTRFDPESAEFEQVRPDIRFGQKSACVPTSRMALDAGRELSNVAYKVPRNCPTETSVGNQKSHTRRTALSEVATKQTLPPCPVSLLAVNCAERSHEEERAAGGSGPNPEGTAAWKFLSNMAVGSGLLTGTGDTSGCCGQETEYAS